MTDMHVTDEQLDRLVDGELPAADYRRLLASLDDEPGGWRRCALAFLEDQALQRDLVLPGPRARPAVEPVDHPATAAGRRSGIWPVVLTMAAGLLVALTIGALFRGMWDGRPAAVENPPLAADNAAGNGVQDDSREPLPADPGPADRSAPSDRMAMPDRDTTGPRPVGNVTLVIGGNGDEVRRIELPYYPFDDVPAARMAGEEFLVPPELGRAVRRTGHDIRERRQILPVRLGDGRRVLVPVDELEIVPVSGRGYQ